MITDIAWVQHVMAVSLDGPDKMLWINPQKNRYIIVLSGWHLCEIHTDGTDEAGDLETALTLCRLHYQQSFSGEPYEKTA